MADGVQVEGNRGEGEAPRVGAVEGASRSVLNIAYEMNGHCCAPENKF